MPIDKSRISRRKPGCVLGCLGLLTPRIIIVLVWLFTAYLNQAYETVLWPVLGFLFMPITTLAYAVGENELADQSILFWIIVGLGIVLDLGLVGGNSWGVGKRS